MTEEAVLEVGDLVRIEFDRNIAFLAGEVDEEMAAGTGLAVVPYRPTFDQDFGADTGSVVLEFLVAAGSGLTSGVLTAWVLSWAERGKPPEQQALPPVVVVELPIADSSVARLRLHVSASADKVELDIEAGGSADERPPGSTP